MPTCTPIMPPLAEPTPLPDNPRTAPVPSTPIPSTPAPHPAIPPPPQKPLNPNAIVSDFLSTQFSLADIADIHHISVSDLIDFLDQPRIQKLLADIERITDHRDRLAAALSRHKALASLNCTLAAHIHAETYKPLQPSLDAHAIRNRLHESARRAAGAVIRLATAPAPSSPPPCAPATSERSRPRSPVKSPPRNSPHQPAYYTRQVPRPRMSPSNGHNSMIPTSSAAEGDVAAAAAARAQTMTRDGAPQREILTTLVTAAELIAGAGAVSSILVLDQEGLLRNGASPNLPADYLDAIDRLKPNPKVGTCAAAAATGCMVVTPDFSADDKWSELRHLPMSLGFVGAWSMPIKAPDGKVLGTFGTYFRERRQPTQNEITSIGALAESAAAAITRSRPTPGRAADPR